MHRAFLSIALLRFLDSDLRYQALGRAAAGKNGQKPPKKGDTMSKGSFLANTALLLGIAIFAAGAITPCSAHGYKALYSFCADQTCARGASGLIQDASGNLDGTTYSGGNNQQGTVFELSPGTGG